jgi:putative FmdB family regulatory protein
MPIYEYRCATCGFEKEYLQKVSDPLLTDCPECGKPTFTKLVSAAGFQLKGSGWYVTDFRDKGKSPDKAKDSGKSEKSESSGQDKKDSSAKDSSESTPAAASGTGASPA